MSDQDPVNGEQTLVEPITSLPYQDLVQACTFRLMQDKIPGTDSYDQHIEAQFIRKYIVPGLDLPSRALSMEWVNLSDILHDPEVQQLAASMKRVLYRRHTGDLKTWQELAAISEAAAQAAAQAEAEARAASQTEGGL